MIKRLFIDIETSPNIVMSWNVGRKISIDYQSILNERKIICVCYKWESENVVHSIEWEKGNDKKLLNKLFPILEKADEIIGHNGDNFDLKFIRTRAIINGIPSFPEIKTLDTLKISRNKFRFNSNRLDYIANALGVGGKIKTDPGLWKDILLDNNKESMRKMVEYCKNDVRILEEVFDKLHYYAPHKTHIGVLVGKDKCTCPNCASEYTIINKRVTLATGIQKVRMKCNSCYKYFTVSKKEIESNDRY